MELIIYIKEQNIPKMKTYCTFSKQRHLAGACEMLSISASSFNTSEIRVEQISDQTD